MARKLPGLQRVLGAQSLALVAYGEIGSSLAFALGVVAFYALGFTPWVLLIVGALFLLVALSYAEGTAAMPEPGGAATFVRRAFNDPAGFLTGWVLLLDYLVVIALAALFVPHYLGTAVGWEEITDSPWDGVLGIAVILGLAGFRLARPVRLLRVAVLLAAFAFVTHLVVGVLGFALLLSGSALGRGLDLGADPSWSEIAFALSLAALAYTGLETVANFAAEAREPGKTLPRSLFAGIGALVLVYVAIGVVGLSAYPAHPAEGGGLTTELGTRWLHAPLVGIAAAFGGELPDRAADALEVFVGVSGALVLVGAVITSIAGSARLAYSLGQHGMLPRAFAHLSRRTTIAPAAIVATVCVASGLLVAADVAGREVRFLASLYSFGVLLAFTAAQVAVVRLRFREPGLERPFRVPGNVRVRGAEVPFAALVGIPLTFALWVAALATHEAARIAGPIWLVLGAAIFVAVRRSRGEALLERVEPAAADLVPEPEGAYRHILVPLKLSEIGEEILATAIKLAEERGAAVRALHVIRVPLDLPLDAPLPEQEERARASLEEAREIAAEHGVEVEGEVVRARSIGEAIVEAGQREDVDLILMGSAPRWRRQSRFFSPTVDYVLRHAPCEVMVVAYPEGVLEGEPAG